MGVKIKKADAQELAYCSVGDEVEGFKIVRNTIKGHSRWSIQFDLVVEKDGKFYRSGYSKGATESQDEQPFEYDDDEIEFFEVVAVEKTVTIYEKGPTE